MGYIQYRKPDGGIHEFQIAGDEPTDEEQSRIESILTKRISPEPEQEEEPGIMSSFGRGILRGVDSVQAGLATAAQSAAEATEEGYLLGKSADDYKAMADEQRRQRDEIKPPPSFFEAEGAYEKATSLAGTLGESTPAMVGSTAALIGGTALGGPAGTALGIGAAGAMFAPQILNENAERQIEQYGYVKDWDKAYTSTALGATAEGVTQAVTLGVAGLLKAPAKSIGSVLTTEAMKRAIERGTKKSLTLAAKRVGAPAAVGAVSGATEETIQSILSRWQAGMPTGDAAAQEEYLEAAVVGGILEGAFGGTAGVAGHVKRQREQRATKDAFDDIELERADLTAREAAIDERTDNAEFEILEQMREGQQRAVEEQTNAGLLDVSRETIVPETPKKFTDDEYQKAIDSFHDGKNVSVDKIRKQLKVGTPKAREIFNEILARNDGVVAGSKNQFLKVIAPKGSGNDVVQRDYTTQSLDAKDIKPYALYARGRKLKQTYGSQKAAEDFAKSTGLDKTDGFEIRNEGTDNKIGVYETQYRNDQIVGKRLVSQHVSQEEANAAAQSLNPAFSPETNTTLSKSQEDQAKSIVRDAVKQQLGENAKALQDHINTMVGPGRVEARVPERIDGYEDRIVEGVTVPPDAQAIEKGIRQIVEVSGGLFAEDQDAINAVGTHEVVHVLRNADLLKPGEWDALLNKAIHEKVPGKRYTWAQRAVARTDGATDQQEGLAEEAIAEMLRYQHANPTALPQKTRSMLQKLWDFIRKLAGLGKTHKADDIIEAILGGKIAEREVGEGGLGVRGYPGKPFYSSVQAHPFYDKLDNYLLGIKQEKASQEQWKGMIRKAGIRKEELDWTGVMDWLDQQESPVSRGDILDYIRAHSLEVHEEIRGLDSEEADRYWELMDEVQSLRDQMEEDFENSPLIEWAERVNPSEFSDGYDAKTVKEWAELARKKDTFHENTTQEGGTGYREMLFHMPMLEPTFKMDGHYEGFPNILVSTRFKERTFNDKKVLAIEEIQSDLHQQGRKHGYQSNDDVFIEEGQFAGLQFIGPRIPDAPLKTTWHEYALKRLVRWAADEGFDAVSWHGEPDSVSATEKWGSPVTEVDGEYTVAHGTPVDGIIRLYTERLPRFARKFFGKFGADPQLIREPLPEPLEKPVDGDYDFDSKFDSPTDMSVLSGRATGNGLEDLSKNLKRAAAIWATRGEITPTEALAGTEIDPDELNSFIEYMENDAHLHITFEEYNSGEFNKDTPFARWELPITPELKHIAREHGFPKFSAVKRADPLLDEDIKPRYSAAAPTGMRVPQTMNRDALDEAHNKVIYNNLAPRIQGLLDMLPDSWTWKNTGKEKVEDTFIAMQDRMLSVGKLVDRMRQNGGFITNENDPYFREQLFSGQTDAALQDADKNFYQPIIDKIHSLDITEKDVQAIRELRIPSARAILDQYNDKPKMAVAELYLYAQHAPERNRVMRERNEPYKSGERQAQYEAGSGMPTPEAEFILDFIDKQRYGNDLNDLNNTSSLRNLIRKLIDATNDVRVDGDLTPDFRIMTRDDGRPANLYKDYVPLRSFIEEHFHPDAETQHFAKTGTGYNIRGLEDKAALGRRSIASNIIPTAILQNEEAIIRAQKNKVGQSFLRLIRENPDFDWEDVAQIIDKPRTKFGLDRKRGVVRKVPDNIKYDDDTLVVKEDGGQEVAIKIKDRRLAEALTAKSSLGNAGLGSVGKLFLKLNHFLGRMNTSYNPEFMIANFLRDLQTAGLNLTEMEMDGLRSEVVKNVLPALKNIYQAQRDGNPNNEWLKLYEEFKRRGAMTAFMGLRNLEDTIIKVNKELAHDHSGAAENVLKPLRALRDMIEAGNHAVENGVRLSAYKSLRDRYLQMSKDPSDPKNQKRAQEQAAFAVKNMTVNFNMGGTLKPTMNAFYLFYNASYQGSMALVNPMLRSKKLRKIWAGVLVAGIMQDILLSMLMPEDDDGISQYDKIPEYVLETHMILPDFTGTSERGYFKIPIPYLMNGIYNAGRAVSRGARGGYTVGETANSVAGTLVESLNPFGSGGNAFLNAVAPTVADPLVDLATNTNFAKAPIAPPESPFGISEKASQRYWNNTSPIYVSVADWLSQLSGSDGKYLEGDIEVSPNQIGFVLEFFGGAAMSFTRRLYDFTAPEQMFGQGVLYDVLSGEGASVNDVPMLRRFVGNISDREDLTSYIRKRDRVLRVRRELRSATEAGDREHYTNVINRYKTEYRLASRINKIENLRKKISRKINKVRENSKLSDAEKERQIEALKERQRELIETANELMKEI